MQLTGDVVQDVLLGGTTSLDSTGQKDKAFQKPKESPFNKNNPDVIFPLTNVAKTQDVLLDGTIFFGNTGQKDRATFMNKNIPIQLC